MSKENLPLIVGITLPIALVVLIAAVIYIPAMFAKPPVVDFIFVDNNYSYGQHYEVRRGKILLVEDYIPEPPAKRQPELEPQIYRYDLEQDKAVTLTQKEAEQLTIDPAQYSSDGFLVSQGGGGGGIFPFFFFDEGRQGVYIRKGAYSEQLNYPSSDIWRYQFLGWIVE